MIINLLTKGKKMLQRKLNKIESDAFALIQVANQLSDAFESGDQSALVQALDDNLVLWVAIKTYAQNGNQKLPTQTKENLIKLSNFVAARTLKMAQNVDERTVKSFVQNNLLIADGLLENSKMNQSQEDAFALISSAIHLSQAKESGDKMEITSALDDNLQLWIAIKTVINKRNALPEEIKANINKIADYVIAATLKTEQEQNIKSIDTMITFNLQIAEGLLAGVKLNQTEEDAFSLLQAAINLATAKETQNAQDLVSALEENIAIWVGIKTNMKQSGFAKDIKDNLLKLSSFIVGKSMTTGKNMDYQNVDILVNTNLQICEGLLERISDSRVAQNQSQEFVAA